MKFKRKLALLTSAVMLMGSFNVPTFGALIGDVDEDGRITADDANLVMQYVLKPSGLTADEIALVEANGNTATNCDENGTDSEGHGITAKDAAYILQQSMLSPFVYALAGTLTDGGSDASAYKVMSYEGPETGTSTETAAEAARTDFASKTVREYFDEVAAEYDSIGDSALSRVNEFLNKVYVNDDKLSSKTCRQWLEDYLNVNEGTDEFFRTFYDGLVDYSNDDDGEFVVSSKEDIEKLFTALEAFNLSETDRDEIIDRIYGKAETKYSGYSPAWLRTTFMVSVYDGVYDYETNTLTAKNVIDTTAMADYREGSANREGDYTAFDWYYYNRTNGDYTDEQPFRDNFAYFVYNFLYPASIAISSETGTVEDLIKAFGGDRVEFTINEGTQPDKEKYEDIFSLKTSDLDFEQWLADNYNMTTSDLTDSTKVTTDDVDAILNAYHDYLVGLFVAFDNVTIDSFDDFLATKDMTSENLTEENIDGLITEYEELVEDELTALKDDMAAEFNAEFDDPVKTYYIDFSQFGYEFTPVTGRYVPADHYDVTFASAEADEDADEEVVSVSLGSSSDETAAEAADSEAEEVADEEAVEDEAVAYEEAEEDEAAADEEAVEDEAADEEAVEEEAAAEEADEAEEAAEEESADEEAAADETVDAVEETPAAESTESSEDTSGSDSAADTSDSASSDSSSDSDSSESL